MESVEYSACFFKLNNSKVIFRSAKITPTKTGQFVTLWKRSAMGPIEPYSYLDELDLFIVHVKKDNRLGHFVFPKAILISKGIITAEKKEGKRAMRVYPPWDITTSKQAQKTQEWQLLYFIEIPSDDSIDVAGVKLLYQNSN